MTFHQRQAPPAAHVPHSLPPPRSEGKGDGELDEGLAEEKTGRRTYVEARAKIQREAVEALEDCSDEVLVNDKSQQNEAYRLPFGICADCLLTCSPDSKMCPACGRTLTIPACIVRFLCECEQYLSKDVLVAIVITAIKLPSPEAQQDFVAATANAIFLQLQNGSVSEYSVAFVTGDAVVGIKVDQDRSTGAAVIRQLPSQGTQRLSQALSVGDEILRINGEAIPCEFTGHHIEKLIQTAASPVFIRLRKVVEG